MNWGTRVPCDYQMALEQQNCKYFFSLVKGHMSDQVSILAGQNRNVVGRLSSFTFYLFFGKKNLFGGKGHSHYRKKSGSEPVKKWSRPLFSTGPDPFLENMVWIVYTANEIFGAYQLFDGSLPNFFCSVYNVQPKLRFRRTWADFSRTLSDDRQRWDNLTYVSPLNATACATLHFACIVLHNMHSCIVKCIAWVL